MIAEQAIVQESSRSVLSRKRLEMIGFYVLVVVAMLPFVIPFLWMITNSLKNQRDLLAIPPTFIFTPTLNNFNVILSNPQLPTYFFTSTLVAVVSTALALILGLPAAFVIARFRMNRLAIGIFLARILPHVSVLIPWYVIFTQLRLTDTHAALILTHLVVGLPLTIWIMIPFYEDTPGELLDAALIDGCTFFGSFRRIALPLSLPGIAVAAILAFTTSWNNFLLSLAVGGPNTVTMPMLAYSQISAESINFGAMAAAGIIVTAPVLILTLFVQRYLIAGLTLGAIRG